MLVVTNKDSLMRGGVCDKLLGGRSCCSHALRQSSIDSQLFVENRDFLHTPPAFDATLGGPRRNIA